MLTFPPKLTNRHHHINLRYGGGPSGSMLRTGFSAARLLAGAIAAFSMFLTPPNVSGQDVPVTNRLERVTALIRDNRLADAEQQLNSILRLRPREAAALNLLGTI